MKSRLPPHNLEAEQSILGGLMLDPNAWDLIVDVVSPEDFYKQAHQQIFLCILELQKKQQPIDILTVSHLLEHRGELDQVGGAPILAQILDQTPSAANIRIYAEIVAEKALLRRLIRESSEIIEAAYDGGYEDINSFTDQVEARIFKIASRQKSEGLVAAREIIKESYEKIEELFKSKASVTGVASGFDDLDKMTTGFQPGELIIIAARPSMGKTAFCLNIAGHSAIRKRKKVAFFSLEMGKEQIMIRLLATESRINISDIRVGRITDSAWPKLINSASVLSEAPLFIDDTSGISPFEIRAKCRRMKAQHGLDMIMIDYLQIMDLKQKVESRERAISEISRTLKAIAKELKVPVIALAQLNRGVESRTDKRPMLSDLRESGSIEQDADVIMMLYRDEYYEKDKSDQKGLAEVVIGKQRNGPTGIVKLAWLGSYGSFANLAPQGMEPPPTQPSFQPKNQGGGGKLVNFAPNQNKDT